MTDMDDLAKRLKEAAEKATPGEWKHYHGFGSPPINEVQSDEGTLIHWTGFDAAACSHKQKKANARYIALCSPANLSLLLAERERILKSNAELLEIVTRMANDDAFADLCDSIGEKPSWLKMAPLAIKNAEAQS